MKYDVCKIQNGDELIDFYTYYCEKCGCELPENEPQIIEYKNTEKEVHYCGECAFKEGLINGEELKKTFYFWMNTNTFQKHYSPIILENNVVFIKNCDYKKIKRECIRFISKEVDNDKEERR